MTIFVYKGLTENTPPEFCSISEDWGELGKSKFGMNVSNEKLLNATKWQAHLIIS